MLKHREQDADDERVDGDHPSGAGGAVKDVHDARLVQPARVSVAQVHRKPATHGSQNHVHRKPRRPQTVYETPVLYAEAFLVHEFGKTQKEKQRLDKEHRAREKLAVNAVLTEQRRPVDKYIVIDERRAGRHVIRRQAPQGPFVHGLVTQVVLVPLVHRSVNKLKNDGVEFVPRFNQSSRQSVLETARLRHLLLRVENDERSRRRRWRRRCRRRLVVFTPRVDLSLDH